LKTKFLQTQKKLTTYLTNQASEKKKDKKSSTQFPKQCTELEKMQIADLNNNPLNKNKLLKKFLKLDKEFQEKYVTFKDLRKKGHVIKTALKFGATFRIYEKENKSKHSKWLCYPIKESKSIKLQDFVAKNRVAHSAKKNLLLAIIDEENCPTYYEISWKNP